MAVCRDRDRKYPATAFSPWGLPWRQRSAPRIRDRGRAQQQMGREMAREPQVGNAWNTCRPVAFPNLRSGAPQSFENKCPTRVQRLREIERQVLEKIGGRRIEVRAGLSDNREKLSDNREEAGE